MFLILCLVLAGMEVLNRAIESIMHSRDRDEWEPIVIHVSDTVMSLWRGEVQKDACQHRSVDRINKDTASVFSEKSLMQKLLENL